MNNIPLLYSKVAKYQLRYLASTSSNQSTWWLQMTTFFFLRGFYGYMGLASIHTEELSRIWKWIYQGQADKPGFHSLTIYCYLMILYTSGVEFSPLCCLKFQVFILSQFCIALHCLLNLQNMQIRMTLVSVKTFVSLSLFCFMTSGLSIGTFGVMYDHTLFLPVRQYTYTCQSKPVVK